MWQRLKRWLGFQPATMVHEVRIYEGGEEVRQCRTCREDYVVKKSEDLRDMFCSGHCVTVWNEWRRLPMATRPSLVVYYHRRGGNL